MSTLALDDESTEPTPVDSAEEILSRGNENFARRNETLPKSFTTEEASQFQRYRYIFYVSDTR